MKRDGEGELNTGKNFDVHRTLVVHASVASVNLQSNLPSPDGSKGVDNGCRGGQFDRSPNISMALHAGTKAPDFTLKTMTSEGLQDVSLSANFGKRPTVLLFFPLAFTSVCTQEFCDVSAGLSAYEGLNADVIGVSVDSPFAQDAWAKKEKITIRLASDLNKETTRAYDVLFPALAGVGDTSARAAFVIDKEGIIRHSEQTPTPKDLPDFAKVKEVLSSLK